MTINLEHPVFSEDGVTIRGSRLIEDSGYAPPGSVEIRWLGDGGGHSLFLLGNDADDFMERYRAAKDAESKNLVLIHEIRKAAML